MAVGGDPDRDQRVQDDRAAVFADLLGQGKRVFAPAMTSARSSAS